MRIAIVNDRPLALEAIRRVVTRDPSYQVVWTARDGEEAVRKCAADRPDLILMDLVMPSMDGAEATRRIMAATPCPVLVVTSTVSGNYGLVFEALGAGAVDAVNTPVLGASGDAEGGEALLAKIRLVAKKVRSAAGLKVEYTPPSGIPIPRLPPPVVAIGASTGGPKALAELLGALPANLPAAVLIAQHLDEDFFAGLAETLRQKTKLPVQLAQPGDRLESGVALLASRSDHLILQSDGTLGYTADPVAYPFRPSVDTLFQSLATHCHQPGVGVLLTGMGRDGAEGLLKLRRSGWLTFAQDAASCVVNGMPDAAVKLGAAAQVLPPAQIGQRIATHLRPQK